MTSPTGRRADNATRKESAIRLAAVDLSERRGFAAVSMADIAAQAGLSERTVYRTFGTKAAIFWQDSFLERVTTRLDPALAHREPFAAVAKAVDAAARAMSESERRLESRRRALVLAEPELLGAGAQSVGHAAKALATELTPPAAPDAGRRLTLFALFVAMALATVPLDPDRPVEAWVEELHDVLHVAAYGPLT